jgi:regulatory protein YycH of two-component signal transduction system YycFG
MTDTQFVTATFALNQYTVTVAADPTAGGSVAGAGAYTHGQAVTVTAAANSGYTFVHWTNGSAVLSTAASYSFTATANETLTATFALNQYTVTVAADPAAGGSVAGAGAYTHGQAVTVTAAANSGYTFVHWTNGSAVLSTAASYSFTATANETLTATFALNQYTVTVAADPAAGGSVAALGPTHTDRQ